MMMYYVWCGRLDLVSVPRKASVQTLADCCLVDAEAAAMRWLCTKGDVGKVLWRAFFEDQRVGVGELLALFPSCTPSLSTLTSVLCPLAPRAYSIASSPLTHPSSVSIAFSVVRMACRLSSATTTNSSMHAIRRMGLCTGYLVQQLQRWLGSTPDRSTSPVLLRIIPKPSVAFRLPGSVAPPLILVGPGTGVAPFMGFLSHRAALEKERRQSGDDTCRGMWRGSYELEGFCDLPCEGNIIDQFIHNVHPGPIHLFFGCRNEADWIFRVSALRGRCV